MTFSGFKSCMDYWTLKTQINDSLLYYGQKVGITKLVITGKKGGLLQMTVNTKPIQEEIKIPTEMDGLRPSGIWMDEVPESSLPTDPQFNLFVFRGQTIGNILQELGHNIYFSSNGHSYARNPEAEKELREKRVHERMCQLPQILIDKYCIQLFMSQIFDCPYYTELWTFIRNSPVVL